MVKGKHDFFTNQFLTLCSSHRVATPKPKNILCHVVPLFWFNNTARRTKVSSTLSKSTKARGHIKCIFEAYLVNFGYIKFNFGGHKQCNNIQNQFFLTHNTYQTEIAKLAIGDREKSFIF
ncbi:hypothetical protein ACB098_03G153200 [Castanea mollissima]